MNAQSTSMLMANRAAHLTIHEGLRSGCPLAFFLSMMANDVSTCHDVAGEDRRDRVDATESALLQSFANCATTISLDTSECEDTLQTGSDYCPELYFQSVL